MTIANVTLTNTFDEWRVRTNQLIAVYDETNTLARASYNATNLAAVTAANLAANVISGNSGVYITIYDNANTITYNVLTTLLPTFYDAANAAYDTSNAAIITSNVAYDQANAARDYANTSNAYIVGYSSNTFNTINIFASDTSNTYNTFASGTLNTINLVFNTMNVEANVTRTIANLAYDTANNFVANASNSVAEVLASNTAIQNTINSAAYNLFVDYLANNDLSYVGAIANAAFETANTGDVTGVNAYDTANSAYEKANTAGGGYFAGNNGFTGNANNISDIFRVHSNTFTGNITFSAGQNASATGPLYMDANSRLEIQDGARVVII